VDEVAGYAALGEWVERLRTLGFEEIRAAYFEGVRQEFFDYEGVTYEVTTEAVWDEKPEGNLRVFVELSDPADSPPRLILETDVIFAPDGSFVGE
jgi:hypothetical protein